jgi:hypothetical protein
MAEKFVLHTFRGHQPHKVQQCFQMFVEITFLGQAKNSH